MMLWSLVSVAFAGDLILSMKVTGPDGRITLQDELVLPADRILPSPDQKSALSISGTVFDSDGAVVEIVVGPMKDGKPKAKVTKSFELEVYSPKTETVVYKKDTWTIESALGEIWDAPPVVAAAPVTDRYVLVWDDAGLVKDIAKLEDPKTIKDPKKLAAATLAEVGKERELPGGRTDPFAQASPMKFLNVHSDKIIEVETVQPGTPGHCQEGGAPLSGAAPTAFVAIADFVPRVTSREVVGNNPDGTGYRVSAGVPVSAVEGSEGSWRVTTGGLSFVIQATAEDLAFYYRPSTHFETGTSPQHLPPGVVGKINGVDVTWAGPEPIPVLGMKRIAAPVATLRVPCAEVRVAPDTAVLVR